VKNLERGRPDAFLQSIAASQRILRVGETKYKKLARENPFLKSKCDKMRKTSQQSNATTPVF